MGAVLACFAVVVSSCAAANASAPDRLAVHRLGAISAASASAAEDWLDEQVRAGRRSVVFEINSPGGDVHAGFALAKHIEASPIPVTCVVDGYGASMASFILQSCDVRIMTKRSLLMFHAPAATGLISGNEHEYRNNAEHLRALTSFLVEHCAARMRISSAELASKISGGREYWLTWSEALAIGAVDMISTPAALR